jgi:O-antigen/teichoic acid export membrane protein
VLNRVAIGSEARRYGIELRTRGWQSEIGVLWRFSVPSLIGSALYVPSNWVCAALLVNQPHGYAEMGAFSAAAQIYGLLLFLPNIVGNVAFPVMSGDTSPTAGDAYRALSLSLKASMLVAVFPALLCLPFSTSVARLFGDSFDENTAVFMVALLAAMPLACFFPYQRFLSARGFAWAATGANLVHSILYVALGLKFVNHGALGLIWARFLAHSADGAYSFLMTKLYKPTKGHLRSFEAIDRDPGMYPQRQS